MIDGDVDDPARAAARARLAARAAHVEGGMAAQAAAEAAVEAVAELAEDVHLDAPRAALASLDVNVDVARTPAAALANGAKRKHIISPPMKSRKHKGDDGSGVDAARAARDLCGDLGEPKEALMRRAIETIGVVAANHLAIEVGRIEGAGGQMTTDGSRRRTPRGRLLGAAQGVGREGGLGLHLRGGEGSAAREMPPSTPRRLAQRVSRGIAHVSIPGVGVRRTQDPPPPGSSRRRRNSRASARPARLTMAERLSAGAGSGASSGGATASAVMKAADGSWAARAAASVRRVASAPAAAVSAAAAAATPAKMEASPAGSDAFTVVTPDNDPAVVAGGSYAARAMAAAEAEAAEAARIRARVEEMAASKAKMAAKLAPAAEPMDEDDADAPAPAPAPVVASAWSVSFASMVRAA